MGDHRYDEEAWREERDRVRWEADQLVAENEKRAAERRKRLRAFTGIGRSYEALVESHWDVERNQRERGWG